MVYKPGYIRISLMIILILVGGLEHEVYFFRYWECHHPNWRTHIFQRGWNHQPGNNMGNIWKQNHEKYMETICPKKHIKRILRKKGRSTCQPVRIFACGGLGDVVLHHFGPAVFWCCFFVEGVDSFWCLCVCHHFLDLNIHFFYAKHCQVKTHTEMTYP